MQGLCVAQVRRQHGVEALDRAALGGAMPARISLASEMAHPLLRGLKWGGAAAGGTALAMFLAKMLHSDKEK